MGISRFLFNGGKLTIYGEKWLDLVRLIACTGHVAGVISNGWWGPNVKKLKNRDDFRLRVGRWRVFFTDTLHILYIEEIKKRDEHTY